MKTITEREHRDALMRKAVPLVVQFPQVRCLRTAFLDVKRFVTFAFVMVLFAVVANCGWAQSRTSDADRRYNEDGVSFRIGGDINVGAEETERLVAVLQGDATIAGQVDVVFVLAGQATLTGAKVGRLIVVEGTANLQNGTVIDRDVELINAELVRTGNVVINGEVLSGSAQRIGRGMLLFGLLFGIGAGIAIIVSGLVAAAVLPRSVRTMGSLITDELGKTVLAAVFVFVGLPVVAFAAGLTIVGLPIAIGIVLFLLPLLGFAGYLISGIRLGDYLLGFLRGKDEAWHPYRAAFVGLVSLLFLGWLPAVGAVISPIAGVLGGGALALKGWRVARIPPRERHAFTAPERATAFGIP